MSEERLLRKLGHLAREEEAVQADLDERWDRLAAGTLTPEEDAELRALAAASTEAREAYEAFRPLGEGFQARLVDRLAAEIEGRAAPAEPRSRSPRLFPSHRAGWWTTAAAAAAMAAGLFVVLRGPGPGTSPPLPSYTADVTGADQPFRGEVRPSSEPRAFVAGGRFEVVLRPDTETEGENLSASCFLLGDGDRRPARPHFEPKIASTGSVKMTGSIPRGLEPGDWTLWAVVGRRGELPEASDPRFLARQERIRERDWIAVPTEIRVRSRDP